MQHIFRFTMNNFIKTIYSKPRKFILLNHGISSQSFAELTGRLVGASNSLHTSSIDLHRRLFTDDTPIEERVYKTPVDWLPFQWHRRIRFNVLRESGDTIRDLSYIDLSLPKPDFELSEELKSTSPEVKQYFSLINASKHDIKEVCKRQLLKRIQRHSNDFDSLEVRIALRTLQIRALFEHHKVYSRWDSKISRVVFPMLIQKRYKLLNQLRYIDEERFKWLLSELQLHFIPPELGVKKERYCKKWDLRRMTKEYCEKKITDKKAAYHEELKKQQEAFLEEKKQVLAWIEEEQKAIEALGV